MSAEKQLVVIDGWRVVDLWWKPDPVDRVFVVLEAPDGARACVGYDTQTKAWSLREEGGE